MNRTFLILVLSAIVSGFCYSSLIAEDDSPRPDLVFLLIGQSNMAGRAALEPGDEKPISNVVMLDDKGHWIPATNPLNRFATNRKTLSMQRIGPGAGFAQEISKQFPDQRIGLIVNARGGSSIQQWGKGQELYVNAMKRLAKVSDLQIDGILWHQGESNRGDRDYLKRLAELISRLRADLKNDSLPFVAGKIYGKATVNDLLDRLPEEVRNTGVASADSLNVFDKVHFDRQSQLTLGQRYAQEMAALLKEKK